MLDISSFLYFFIEADDSFLFLGYLPGIIHAIFVIGRKKENEAL